MRKNCSFRLTNVHFCIIIIYFIFRTLCGTPNYIAPEILNKVGHSFEVDIWSVGCIMYTLLVGRPPFETSSLKETYSRIKQVQYKTPTNISKPAMTMITNILQGNPAKRPTATKLLKDLWFTSGKLLATNLSVKTKELHVLKMKGGLTLIDFCRIPAGESSTLVFDNGTAFRHVGITQSATQTSLDHEQRPGRPIPSSEQSSVKR